MSSALVNKPSLIERGPLRFLIMDAPKESNLHIYIKECKKYNVTQIVRISEPSYSKEEVENAGIGLHVRTDLFVLVPEADFFNKQTISGNVLSRWLQPSPRYHRPVDPSCWRHFRQRKKRGDAMYCHPLRSRSRKVELFPRTVYCHKYYLIFIL